MSSEKQDLEKAKRLIGVLSRACRQTQVFFEGNSCLDKRRILAILHTAIKATDDFSRGD